MDGCGLHQERLVKMDAHKNLVTANGIISQLSDHRGLLKGERAEIAQAHALVAIGFYLEEIHKHMTERYEEVKITAEIDPRYKKPTPEDIERVKREMKWK